MSCPHDTTVPCLPKWLGLDVTGPADSKAGLFRATAPEVFVLLSCGIFLLSKRKYTEQGQVRGQDVTSAISYHAALAVLLVASNLSVSAMTLVSPAIFLLLGYAAPSSKHRVAYWYALNGVLACLVTAHAVIRLVSEARGPSATFSDTCVHRWIGLLAEYPGDK